MYVPPSLVSAAELPGKPEILQRKCPPDFRKTTENKENKTEKKQNHDLVLTHEKRKDGTAKCAVRAYSTTKNMPVPGTSWC